MYLFILFFFKNILVFLICSIMKITALPCPALPCFELALLEDNVKEDNGLAYPALPCPVSNWCC
jgi:hypothetical protein